MCKKVETDPEQYLFSLTLFLKFFSFNEFVFEFSKNNMRVFSLGAMFCSFCLYLHYWRPFNLQLFCSKTARVLKKDTRKLYQIATTK